VRGSRAGTSGRRTALALTALFVVATLVPFGFAAGAPASPAPVAPVPGLPAVAPVAPAAMALSHPAGSPPASGRGTFWDNQVFPTAPSPTCAYQSICMNDSGDPSIVSTSAGVLAVAYTALTNISACPAAANYTLSQVGFSVSTNGGSTWSTPTLLGNTNCTVATEFPSAIEPALAVLPNGTFVLAYIDYNASSSATCSGYIWYPALNPCFLTYDDLVVQYSANNGTTWTSPQILNATNNSGLATNAPVAVQPAVVTDGNTIYVAWTNFSYPEYDQPAIAPSIGANLRVSSNGGGTWGSALQFPIQAGLWGSAVSWIGYAPQLAVNATGTLFATYATDLNTVTGSVCSPFGCAVPYPAATESIVVARSSNNGSTFSSSVVATGVPIQWNGNDWANGGPGSFLSPEPAIALDPSSGQVYVAYAGGEVGNVCFARGSSCSAQEAFTNVWVANSTDAGVTWSTPVALGNAVLGLSGTATGDDNLFLPSIGVAGNGTVYVDVAQQNTSACLSSFCGLQSNLIFVSTDDGASFPTWYTPYPNPTVNNYPLWDGIASSMTILQGVPYMAWTLENCPGNGVAIYCNALNSYSWSQVVVTSPFTGTGVTVSFTQTGLSPGSQWTASLSGNVRGGPANATLSVSGVPTGYPEVWSAGWLNTSAYGVAYVPTTTVVSPGTFSANTTVPFVYAENALVAITTVPPGYPGESFNCPSTATFAFDCANLAVAPFVGSTYEPFGTVLSYGVGPGPVPLSSCGDCLNVSFLRWTGSGAGSWNGSAANGSSTIQGPVNETASFTLLSICDYGTCTNVTYTYVFSESGLPSGTDWTVTLGNQTGSATTPTIGFNASQGPVNFSVWVVPYNATYAYFGTPSSPSPVSFPQGGAEVVTFSLEPIARETSVVTALASGLPAGVTSWGLAFGTTEYSVVGNATFPVADGPVNLSASPVYGPADVGAYPLNFEVSPEVVGAANTTLSLGASLNVSGPVLVTALYAPEYWLSVTGTAGGSVSGPSDAWVHAGTPENLSATPSANYAWVGWSGSGAGSYTGTAMNITIRPNSPVTELATFVAVTPTFTLNVTATGVPAGTPVTVSVGTDNFSAPVPFVLVGLSSGSYTVTVPTVYPNDTTGVRYPVASVTSSLPLVDGSLSVAASGSLAIAFTEQVTVSVGPAPDGTTTPAAGTYWEPAGAPLTLTETPNTGYAAAGWTGTTASTNASLVLSPSVPQTETPKFVASPPPPPLTYTLTLTETGLPAGALWSAEVGASGLAGSGNLLVSGLNGSVAVVVPTVLGATGVRYAPSNGGAYPETIDADHTLTVAFTTQYFVSVTASAGGTATPASTWVNSSGQVSITALANATSAFVNWSGWGPGAYNGTSASTVLTVTGPISQVATFAPHATSSSSNGGGTGTYALPIGILVVLLVVGLGVGILIARSRGGSPPPEAPSDEGDTTWPSENPAPEESGDAAGGSVGPEPE
jgi:hypothetical protein